MVTDTGESVGVPGTHEEARRYLAARGFSELTHKINYRFGFRTSTRGVVPTFTATVAPLPPSGPPVDWSVGTDLIKNYSFEPFIREEHLAEAAIIQPSDYQVGKTDIGGGTAESTARALGSFARFAEFVKECRPQTILIANTGDIIENFCNTAAQPFTNDLDLPHQVAHAFNLEVAGIRILADLAPRIVYATVPSNHGQWRNATGIKGSLGDSHADWGISIAEQVASALSLNESLSHVEVHAPPKYMESMSIDLGTTKVGLVHGHQVNNPEKLGDWWAGQDHGRMPTWNADILLVGHHHSFRSYQSGDGRWVFVGPSSDPGSAWYANLTGQRAVAGMLTMTVEKGAWGNLQIL